MIHPTAIIEPGARLAGDVEVGPYTIIGDEVEIASGSVIGPHVVLKGPARIGRDNRIFQFASIGDDPQDKKYSGERTRLEIGDGNTIREYTTISRGTEQGGGVTRIGNDNWIMAYCHIAHDCMVGSHIVMANAATIAGHVVVEDHAILGGFTAVHQFCHLGAHCFTAVNTTLYKDIPPFVTAAGNPAVPRGINVEGLKRRGFDPQVIQAARKAYKLLYKSNLRLEQARPRIDELSQQYPELDILVAFLQKCSRGIVR